MPRLKEKAQPCPDKDGWNIEASLVDDLRSKCDCLLRVRCRIRILLNPRNAVMDEREVGDTYFPLGLCQSGVGVHFGPASYGDESNHLKYEDFLCCAQVTEGPRKNVVCRKPLD